MNNFEKYTFIKEKLNTPRFDNEDEEIDWFTKHLYGLYNQASRLREENNNYMARIDKYKIVLDKILKLKRYTSLMEYDEEFVKVKDILELLEEIE